MQELSYSKNELDYIKDTLGIVLKDVRNIFDVEDQGYIFLETKLDGEKYILAIDDKRIALLTLSVDIEEWRRLWKNKEVNFSYPGNCLLEKVILPNNRLRYKSIHELNSLVEDKETTIVVQFLTEYDRIREELITHIKNTHESKEEIMRKLSQLRCKYGSEVSVDFGESNSLNIHELSVKEENGKKIGTIDFGSRIVKIVTEGDIVLTRLDELKEKVQTK